MSQGDLRTAPHVAGTDRPLVVSLSDEAAGDPALTGGKAAALARAVSPASNLCLAWC